MNLWVNRLKQLPLLAVALFFFACEDETSLNGFKNPNQKFKGKYVEIPLETSNLLLGKIRTSNNYFSTEYNRLMVGQYVDTRLDTLKAHAITQFIPGSITKMPAEHTIDSITVVLEFDMTTYGAQGVSDNQKISLYQLQNPVYPSWKRTAYSNTVIAWNPDAKVGEKVFSVNPKLLREYDSLNSSNSPNDADKVVALRFKVDPGNAFYTRLKDRYETYSSGLSGDFILYDRFSVDFPGLAFVSSSANNKVVAGFRLGGTSGVKIFHSKKTATDTTYGVMNLPFNNQFLFSYNRIDAIRLGELAGQVPFQEQPKTDGLRYVQAGTGQVVKLHLDRFFEFAEEMKEKRIVINSAQLVIEDVEQPSNSALLPPRALGMRVLQEDNQFPKYKMEDVAQDRDSILFLGLISTDYEFFQSNGQLARPAAFASDSSFYAVSDGGGAAALTYVSGDKKYSGFLTLLMQRLYKQIDAADRWKTYALYPTDASVRDAGAKTVNRLVFPSTGVKLKIYYTEPNVNQQD